MLSFAVSFIYPFNIYFIAQTIVLSSSLKGKDLHPLSFEISNVFFLKDFGNLSIIYLIIGFAYTQYNDD